MGYNSEGRLIDEHENGGAEDMQFKYLNPAASSSPMQSATRTTVYLNLYGAAAETIDALGNVTQYYYDSDQNLIKVVGPQDSTSTYTYDANGNLTSSTDPLGLTTYFHLRLPTTT